MALQSLFWNANKRLQRAADNNKAMKQKEPDREAVILLQKALINVRIAPDLAFDGIFGPKTAAAVRKVEERFNMDLDGGDAGRQVLGILDILLQGGELGADLARKDTVLAGSKVRKAIRALVDLQTARSAGAIPSKVTIDALRTHFRLVDAPATIGVARVMTDADIEAILKRFRQLLDLFAASSTRFRTGVPVNGIFTVAEAPLGGPIRFGPGYTDKNSNFGKKIGPNSRAAVVIHEGVHVFDGASGKDGVTHISEFDPAYDRQPADQSLHNPSSFAGFAAHIDLRRDPQPRFGLAAAQGQ